MGMVIYMLLGHRVRIVLVLSKIFMLRFCEGGELFFYICQRKFLSEREAALIMKQCFSALKYLHEHKISHR